MEKQKYNLLIDYVNGRQTRLYGVVYEQDVERKQLIVYESNRTIMYIPTNNILFFQVVMVIDDK